VKHYRRTWDRYLGRQQIGRTVAFRHDDACPVWLNLDWNSGVPGGPYATETWAVAVTTDGHTATLSANRGAPAAAPTRSGTAATSPR
jgi:hypothetical protein